MQDLQQLSNSYDVAWDEWTKEVDRFNAIVESNHNSLVQLNTVIAETEKNLEGYNSTIESNPVLASTIARMQHHFGDA